MTTLGVIVPCHNEARVIARKLRNLAACAWPASDIAHRIIVVDDGSRDWTLELARREAQLLERDDLSIEVIQNGVRPGKSGAIACGLARLGSTVDLVVLTDADVVLSRGALRGLARAFEREPELGLATGAQTFVAGLAADGTLRGEDGVRFKKANTLYDVGTAWVRALESRFGLVFSVHGQLLAWRRELELAPTPRIAADDLDLMLQVRTRGLRTELVRSARFFEVRAPAGNERELQAVRRSRAYLQFLEHPRIDELLQHGHWLRRWHASLYVEPSSAGSNIIGLLTCLGMGASLGWLKWGWVAAIVFAALGFLAQLPVMLVIRQKRRHLQTARTMNASFGMSDRWETAR